MNPRPSRKYRRRERRAAARHGLTLDQYRTAKEEPRKAAPKPPPAEAWASWREQVTT